jgi:hypothetical protein
MGAFAPLGSWSVYGFNLPRRRARTASAGTAHNLHGVPAGCKDPAIDQKLKAYVWLERSARAGPEQTALADPTR